LPIFRTIEPEIVSPDKAEDLSGLSLEVRIIGRGHAFDVGNGSTSDVGMGIFEIYYESG
jgi:hypothetical protein